ncbi:MAG: hypothetical protein KGH54_03920 [Candidatus Micrarchaeota archaeon]|nr:hypothetical protein [Candidatus Micrarchaeota archaeon]
MTHTILLAGFGPYLEYETNLSGVIARQLNGKRIRNARIIGIELPTKHRLAARMLRDAVRKENPDIIIGTGLAVKGHVSLERVAINNFYTIGKEGESDETLEADGKMAYHSKLPLKKIRNALQKGGIPAEYSFFAGTYMCNEAFYEIMKLAQELKIRKAGFVHIPLSHQQAISMKNPNLPSMDEKTIEKAVRMILAITVLAHEPKSSHFK